MDSLIERLIITPLEGLAEKVLLFLPNLFTGIVFLVIGIISAWLVKSICMRAFHLLRLDGFSRTSGITGMLTRAGVQESLSAILAKSAGGIVFFAFVFLSLSSLNMPAIERLFERFFLYLPNVFVALLIVILGYLSGNFLGRAALIASVNAGMTGAGMIGRMVRWAVSLFSIVIALEQLGIGKQTVLVTFAILFGGIVLALAIAFGYGGRDLAQSYLQRKLSGREDAGEDSDIEHI